MGYTRINNTDKVFEMNAMGSGDDVLVHDEIINPKLSHIMNVKVD